MSPNVEESPMVRLSQQAVDVLMLRSPLATMRSPHSPQANLQRRFEDGQENTNDIAHLTTAIKSTHNRLPAVGLCINWTCRKEEDRAIAEGDSGVMAVFDGHLGSALSQLATDIFLPELRNAARVAGVKWESSSDCAGWARVGSVSAAKDILTKAFRSCHEEARRRQKRGGCTALVFWSCLVNGRTTGFCANAGDSRAVLRSPAPSHAAPAPFPVASIEQVALELTKLTLTCTVATATRSDSP